MQESEDEEDGNELLPSQRDSLGETERGGERERRRGGGGRDVSGL